MTTLADLDGSRFAGIAELWLDPTGDQVERSDFTLAVDGTTVSYTRSHDGKGQSGSIAVVGESAEFVDTFHSPEAMKCEAVSGARGLFQLEGRYGPDSDWGWRIGLSFRTPTGELVLQMTNIAPWGEEARAVRMVRRLAPTP